MGEVFLAYDERLDRLVAIKRMRPDVLADPSRRERLRREARAAARLSHPNVVQVFDLEEDEEGGDAIVLEYVQGRTIAEMLRDGALPVTEAVDLAAQVADGLAAAHAAGLVHRDLKAENVVVTAEGRAKVLDFGLVKPLDPGADSTLTEQGAVLGTYRAMAPEQAEGAEVDARADLFSLGVLLYEMLAGRSPFQGATPVATLRNLTGSAAQPLATARPEVPEDLAGLVHALLEKEPERRPAGAREVAVALRGGQGAGSAGTLTPSVPLSHSHSHPPGEGEGRWKNPASGGSYGRWRPLSRAGVSAGGRGGRGVRVLAAAGVVAVLTVLVSWVLTSAGLGRQEPLRVAVPRPVIAAGAEGLDLAASGTLVAVLRGLVAFEGVAAIDPSQIGEVRGTALDVARAAAADEVLTLALDPVGPGEAYVTLRRIEAAKGGVLWAERFVVPTTRDSALFLAEGVAAAIRRAYPRQEVRDGLSVLEAQAGDYAEFVEIWQRLQEGRGAWAPELDRLDAVASRSPKFLEAHLQAAALAFNLFRDSRNPEYLARARTSLERARILAPGHPRILSTEIVMALGEGQLDQAEQALTQLEERIPGDATVAVYRSRIAAARGDLAEAVALLRSVVEARPYWRYLVELADLELKTGEIGPARGHLEAAAARVPGNTWPVAKLGELELVYGDLRRAERIYRDLVAAGPQRSDLTNLGLVRFLLRDYTGAVESYRQALQMEPGHVTVTLNLADAELALGRTAEARSLYRQTLATLSAKEGLSPVERCLEAQCRAHLGETGPAVEMALDTLQGSPQDAEVTYQAAIVFGLAGENASALAMARKARELGVQSRWFTIPAFDQLRQNASFQALLTETPRRPG
jgi:eukaryotic-like serine/threonine-protein kinase